MEQVDIKGFETYQITDDGRVWSKISNKWLKPSMNDRGYLVVTLIKEKNKYRTKVHRLVAEAFIPNPYNKPCIDHINTIRNDNNKDNLRWCTPEENSNNILTKQKQKNAQCKKVVQYSMDEKIIKIWNSARECGINGFNYKNISDCCNGRAKTHRGFKWSFLD